MRAESKNQDTDFKGFQAVFFKKQNVKENSHVQQVMGSKPKGALAYRPGLLLLLSKGSLSQTVPYLFSILQLLLQRYHCSTD